MKKNIFATWCISNNLGDALNVWLISKITGQTPVYVDIKEYCNKYMCIGSILNWANSKTIVWGAGLANKSDIVSPDVDIRAVRGPISRNIALNFGAKCPEVYGDPALLVPRFYNPNIEVKYKLGIIPHYVEQFVVSNTLFQQQECIKIINVFDPIEKVIDDIKSCEKILASSLHGFILSQAYNVPVQWFTSSNSVGGDGTKFHDYFQSVGYPITDSLKWCDIITEDLDNICSKITPFQINIDLDKLMKACPFYET